MCTLLAVYVHCNHFIDFTIIHIQILIIRLLVGHCESAPPVKCVGNKK